MSDAAPAQLVRTPSPEDLARASLYGLIARLFYAPPDEQLLSELLQAPGFDLEEDGGPPTARGEALAEAWRAMIDACRTAFPVMLEQEHTELFVGTGKALVTPYLSHYLMRDANDSPLVELREQLARWGLERREGVGEYEDHIAGMCESLRYAIAVQQRSLEEQKEFFDRFLYRAAVAFCDAVRVSPKARFYALVADVARAFLELEREAFDMA